MNTATTEPLHVIPIIPGTPFGGGIYAGRLFIGDQAYALIVAPKDGERAEAIWNKSKKAVAGATSYCDGHANTEAMAAAGSELALWAQALIINGETDWYLPSRLEALIAFGEVKDQFEEDWYWTSSQYAGYAECAWYQGFDDGDQSYDLHKDYELRARAVRRVPI